MTIHRPFRQYLWVIALSAFGGFGRGVSSLAAQKTAAPPPAVPAHARVAVSPSVRDSQAVHGQLIAAAEIREVGPDRHAIYLPVTIQGHRGTILLYFFQSSGVHVMLSQPALAALGVKVPATGTLDSVVIGTAVAPNLSVQVVQAPVSSFDVQTDQSPAVSTFTQAKLPPVVGMAGNDFLERYDLVIDGPHRRVRLYAHAPGATTSTAATLGKGLPPGITAADCQRTQAMAEGHVGFPVQVNGKPVIATLQTLFGGRTIMNTLAAKHLGFTQHSANIQVVPESQQTLVYQGVPDKYIATDIHVTLGKMGFRTTPVHVLARAPLQPSDTTPTMELTLENLLDQVFVESYSTGQACLGK